ncbi:MAG TPA: hypothetical protein VGL05_20090 [Kribbella sp.]
MADLNLAGSQFTGSSTELFLIAGCFAAAVVVDVVLFLVLNKISMAQARGYDLTPNPAAARYELVLGAPQTAFTGNPRAAYVVQMLDGRPEFELPIVGAPLSLPELMVVAHSRGYTVQKNDDRYSFMRHLRRP